MLSLYQMWTVCESIVGSLCRPSSIYWSLEWLPLSVWWVIQPVGGQSRTHSHCDHQMTRYNQRNILILLSQIRFDWMPTNERPVSEALRVRQSWPALRQSPVETGLVEHCLIVCLVYRRDNTLANRFDPSDDPTIDKEFLSHKKPYWMQSTKHWLSFNICFVANAFAIHNPKEGKAFIVLFVSDSIDYRIIVILFNFLLKSH